MRARILYDDGSSEELYELAPGVVEFGETATMLDANGAAHRVAIHGSRIFGLQFNLRQEGSDWTLTHLGMAPTWLNGRQLSAGELCAIGPNDVVRVPGIRIDLLPEEARKPGAGTLPSPAAASNWQDFQEAIHASLRDEFELDQQNRRASVTNDEVRAGIESKLHMLVESATALTDEKVVLDLVRIALRRTMTRTIAATSADTSASPEPAETGAARDQERIIARRIEQVATDTMRQIGIKVIENDSDSDVFEKLELLEQKFEMAFERTQYSLSFAERRQIAARIVYQNIHDLIFALGPLSDLMELDVVTEVMVARFDRIYIEKAGRIEPYPYVFANETQLIAVIQRMLSSTGRSFNKTAAMVDFRHVDGSRVNVIGDPLSVRGAALTIRKFPRRERPSLQKLASWNALSPHMARFLEAVVLARKNIVISGGTGSGKTTLLNALGRCIKNERLVTIEDTAELNLGDIHVISLQSRAATVESQNAVTIRDLVKNALRMRPDRIIVGECRGGEALDMLQAMNTGHAGSMTTAHANSPQDMMLRLETMVLQAENLPVLAIRQQIVSGVDVLVQLNRLASGQRVVTDISEIVGIDPESGQIIIEPIFIYRATPDSEKSPGRFHFTGYLPTFVEEILRPSASGNDLHIFG